MMNITREEAMFELLKTLNRGNSSSWDERVRMASEQIRELERMGVKFKNGEKYE